MSKYNIENLKQHCHENSIIINDDLYQINQLIKHKIFVSSFENNIP